MCRMPRNKMQIPSHQSWRWGQTTCFPQGTMSKLSLLTHTMWHIQWLPESIVLLSTPSKSFCFFPLVYQVLQYRTLLRSKNLALLATAIIKTCNTSTPFVAEMQVNAHNPCRTKLINPHQNNHLAPARKLQALESFAKVWLACEKHL